MRVDDFDFDLPEALIALRPQARREDARLLVVRPQRTGAPVLEDRFIKDLPDILEGQDCLVFNDTKVIPALLHCTRTRGGVEAHVDITLHRRLSENRFAAFARPAKRLKIGDQLICGGLQAQVSATGQEGEVELSFPHSGTALDQAIAKAGTMPLPPYIASKRDVDAQDAQDYQTIFAAHEGAVAAPTAGLHFTPELMARLAQKGVSKALITLHVGAGTFLPVKAPDTQDHRMHAERVEISPVTADAINRHRSHGRIVAVGTTSLRSLESAADSQGRIAPFKGETRIFILPGHCVRSADILMTNFHLPRSTLFMLVCAFSGISVMKAAYAHAIDKGYRFYSYGDACLLFPQSEM